MSKKIGKKIWIYVGVGVFLVIVGIISWGVATDWKFIGDSKKSGGGGPPPPPPPPPPPSPSPSDKCDGKCKKDETCCQSIKDGTTYKCCPNTIPDPVFDGNKCCSRDKIVDNKCCDNPSKNTIKTTSFFKEIYGKQCCDTKPYDKSDSNGCYELCGDNTTKCYQLKGEYCPDKPDSDDGKYQCVSNPECQWESLPSPSPITDQSIPCSSDSDCRVGSCDSINNKCNIHTVGLTNEVDDFKGDEYRFTFMEDDYKPTNWRFERKMEVQETAQDKKCTKNDCKIAFQNYNPAGEQWNTTTGVCSALQNLDSFNKKTKCPFTDTTRCCVKSGDPNAEFTGQICEVGKVGAINENIATSSGGYLSECVDSGDCVDTNGEVCGGNGYCQYDSTLNDGNGGGKCVCPSPPDVTSGGKCEAIMPFHLYEYDILTSKGGETRATWRMIPFKTCGSKQCNVQYFDDYNCPAGKKLDYCTKDQYGYNDLFKLTTYLEEELKDYEVINNYQIYQIIDNGLYDTNPRTGPNFPPRALTIAGASTYNKSNSWTSIVNDTGNKYKNDGFQSSRVYNSFLIYKKKNQSISDGIYIFAFGYFMHSYVDNNDDTTGFMDPSDCWLNISSKYSKTSSTPTTFYFKKAKKCCDADNIDCNTYNYCQINGIQNSQYGIDSNNKGTCSDFDENITVGGSEDGTACTPNLFSKYYRFTNRCSLSNGQTKTKNACVYRCTNQQSKYCFGANPGDNNGIDICICQRSVLMTAKTTKPFKWDFSNTDGSGVWKEVFLK